MSRPFESELPVLHTSLVARNEDGLFDALLHVASELDRLANFVNGNGAEMVRLVAASRAVHLALVELGRAESRV